MPMTYDYLFSALWLICLTRQVSLATTTLQYESWPRRSKCTNWKLDRGCLHCFCRSVKERMGFFSPSSGQKGLENWEALTEQAAPGESCLLCTNGLIVLAKTTFVWLQDQQIQRKSSWLKHIQMCYDSVTFHKEDTMVLKSLITP